MEPGENVSGVGKKGKKAPSKRLGLVLLIGPILEILHTIPIIFVCQRKNKRARRGTSLERGASRPRHSTDPSCFPFLPTTPPVVCCSPPGCVEFCDAAAVASSVDISSQRSSFRLVQGGFPGGTAGCARPVASGID